MDFKVFSQALLRLMATRFKERNCINDLVPRSLRGTFKKCLVVQRKRGAFSTIDNIHGDNELITSQLL
jgi:hypothetical protein